MSDTQTQRPLPRLLAYALIPIPVAGWIAAQFLTARIAHPSHYTGEYLHAVVTSTFAVVFFISTVIGAVTHTRWHLQLPRSDRPARYVRWQVALLAVSLAWLACILGQVVPLVELILAAAIAVLSVIASRFATRRDPAATVSPPPSSQA